MKPVSYASPLSAVDAPRVGIRTVAAAVWLITILAVTASAFDAFTTAQAQVGYVGRYLALTGSVDGVDRVLRWAVGPAVSAALFGMFAAAALWHWPRQRLTWAVVVPLAATLWAFFNPLTATRPSGGFGYPPFTSAVVITAVQCAGVYAGTRCGRPAARWLTSELLPPSLRDALTTLWR